MTALLVGFFLAVAVLLIGCRLAISLLPPFGRSILGAAARGTGKALYWALFGTGYKGGK